MNIYYNDDYHASDFAFETTRKAGWIAQALLDDPIDGIEVHSPASLYERAEQLARIIHDARYIHAIKHGTPKHLAESQGFSWDDGIYPMAIAHCAGLVAATLDAHDNGMSGSLSSGLHHASDREGAGFCTFNGLAAAAWLARTDLDSKSTMILDFDAHCGGGTYSMVQHFATQVDVSTSPFDSYITTSNIDYLKVVDPDRYLSSIQAALRHARQVDRDFIIYNAGMDPLNDGVPMAVLAEREHLVADFVRTSGCPAIFALAGGYLQQSITADTLVDAHLLTLNAWK